MKKLLPIILLITIPLVASAQFEKGLKQVGGVFTAFQDQSENGYTTSGGFITSFESTSSEIRIIPRLGFFVSDNTSIGFGIGYSRLFNSNTQLAVNEQTFDVESTISTLELEFYSRFHKSISDNFLLFLQPTLTGSFGNSSVGPEGELESRVIGYGIGVTPGLVYMLNDKFGLEAAFGRLGYSRQTSILDEPDLDSDIKNIDTSFGIDLSLRSFELGLQYYF